MSAGEVRPRPLRPIGKLLAEDTRRHHRSLILQHLFAEGPASRADLARATGLTRVTVSDLVGGLIADGLLGERPAAALRVGLDIGATKVLGAVMDADGTVVTQSRQDTAGNPEAAAARDRFAAGVADAVRMVGLTVDPAAIIIGGGVAHVGEPLLAAVTAALARGRAARGGC